jgi:hypothetical protein
MKKYRNPIFSSLTQAVHMNSLAAAPLADPASGTYIHWSVINISLTNALIILGMIVVFALAILLPFPRASSDGDSPAERGESR